MKVTVADCLELQAFKDSEVVGGRLGLSNDVKSVSVLDAGKIEDLDFYGGNNSEILLTGFLGFRDDVAKQCSFVRSVAKKGCAALAVYYVGKGISELDAEVAAVADEAALPLILMPGK